MEQQVLRVTFIPDLNLFHNVDILKLLLPRPELTPYLGRSPWIDAEVNIRSDANNGGVTMVTMVGFARDDFHVDQSGIPLSDNMQPVPSQFNIITNIVNGKLEGDFVSRIIRSERLIEISQILYRENEAAVALILSEDQQGAELIFNKFLSQSISDPILSDLNNFLHHYPSLDVNTPWPLKIAMAEKFLTHIQLN